MLKVQLFRDGCKRLDLDGKFLNLAKAIEAAEIGAEKPCASGKVTGYRIMSDGGVTELEAQVANGQRRFVSRNMPRQVC
jgi:hypothetical protein